MIQIQYVWSSPMPEAADSVLSPQPSFLCCDRPRRRRLRHYLVGSPEDTQRAIDRLHLLHFADRIEWSRSVQVAENGIIIRPDPGDVLRYMQRER